MKTPTISRLFAVSCTLFTLGAAVTASANQQPGITAPATASGSEGTAIATITATATDADATDNLTITQVGKPASLVFTAQAPGLSPRTATITGTPTFTDAGSYSIVFTVNDGTGTANATASTTTVLFICNCQSQPAITAPATASGAEGSPIATITAIATDADAADNLTITQTGKPASLTFTAQAPGPSPRTAAITGTPSFTAAGTYTIVWTVNDGTGTIISTASATTVLTIANVNQRPAITAPATASGSEGTAIATITATATDADAMDFLTITQTGKPASLTFAAQAAGPSPRTATITGTPGFTDAGTYSIVWTVNDGTGATNATASATTALAIANTNQPPAISAPATASGALGTPIAPITATATDADAADVLTITQTGKPVDLTFTTNSPGVSPRTATITGAPGCGDAGPYNIVWTVNDGIATASTTTVLTIASSNQRPTITAPATATGAEGSAIATITATATDPDCGNTLTITQTGMPACLTFTAQPAGPSPRTATITGAPAFGCAGTYSIVWTVNDGTGAANATASTTTVLTIAGSNQQPAIAAPAAVCAGEGGPIAPITATATDADAADVLTITQSGKPASLTFTTNSPGVSPRTAQITGTPGFTDAGIYSIVWTVNDGTGAANATASTTTVLTIASSNQRPTITAPATATGAEGSAIATITATGTDADQCNNLTITQAGMPASLTFTAQAAGPSPRTAQITGTPAFGSSGTYTIVWTVNDGTGAVNATASTTTVLTITSLCSGRPPITAPATASGTEGIPITPITATATDPCNGNLTITQAGMPASLTFTAQAAGPSPRTATITGTPSFGSAGTYSIVWTVNNGTGTTNATASTTTVLTISVANRQPAIIAPAVVLGAQGCPLTITATATDADAADVLTITQTGKPADLLFTTNSPGVSPRTAQITGTPGFTDAGSYSIVWTVNDGSGATNATASTTTVLTITNGNSQPTITAPATASGAEGNPIAPITATATDCDAANTLTITHTGRPASLTFTAQAPGLSPRTATIAGTPAFGSAGTYSIVWTVNDGTGTANATASTTTVLTITRGPNRCPVANPGGPYSGITGAPISFDGTGSSDPDGDPLTYAWDFDASNGITVDATGPMPVHTYLAAGIFTVTLTVRDNGNGDPAQACSNAATTTATIVSSCPATVFNGYDVIRLASDRPTWFAFVQPAGGCYMNTDVVLSSFVLKYAGNQIPASARKTFVGGDKSGDGIEEIRVTFSKTDLRSLFAGLPNGHNVVEVAIEANLATGGMLQGTTQVDAFNSGSSSAALISPNPMNPAATLTFTTTRSGFAKVEMFDIGGHLVRTILDERSLSAGVHEVRIEGQGRRGERLASGIYFIRGVSADGEFTQTIAILK